MGAASVAAVNSLLTQVGHDGAHALDAEIVEYICSVVEDPDPESSLEILISVLSECVGAFAALTAERQAQLVLQLLDDAKPSSGTDDAGGAPASTADDSSMQAVVAALRQATLHCHEPTDASRQASRTASAAGSCSSSSSQDAEDVEHLLVLCMEQGISRAFLQDCLRHSYHGDVQAAANWLLEVDPTELRRAQQAWQQDRQQREQQQQEAELLQKRQKKLIVDKFDLRAVSDSSSGSKKGGWQAGPDLLQVPKKLAPQESKLRYRDGKVVSTKGEKVIIEKVGEEWDGGSRGKVYTKGKRGKGFH